MARRVSARTIRSLAPVVVPMAIQSMRRGRAQADGVLDEVEKTAKKSRSDFEDIRDEAITRGIKLMDEAKKHGTELLDLLAAKGVDVAQDWADALRPKRRRFRWGRLLLVISVLGAGVYAYNRYAD